MEGQYTAAELDKLHETLYEILAEIDRICEKHGIPYFITGGTAIGAYFWEAIIPWDDDVDVGMTRRNYERFLEVAPKELGDRYFLQSPQTDPHVPFYFAKIRKNDTLFCENQFKGIDMHQGIFVDIFPFDSIPDDEKKEKRQNAIMNFFNGCLIAKEIWQYDKFGKCEVEEPRKIGWMQCLVIKLFTYLPKRCLFYMVRNSQTKYNGGQYKRCKQIATDTEWLYVEEAEHPKKVKLGKLQVYAPADLKAYLLNHYGNIRKDIPEEQRVNHRPAQLKF